MTPTREQLDKAKTLSLRLLGAVNGFAFQADLASPREKPEEFLRRMNQLFDEVKALHGKRGKALDVVRPFLVAANASREPVTVLGATYPTAHEAVSEVAHRALSMGEFDAWCKDEREFARLWRDRMDALVPWGIRGPDDGQLVSRIELEYASAIAALKEPRASAPLGKNGAPLVNLEKAKKKWASVRDASNRETRGRLLRERGLETVDRKWTDPDRQYSDIWKD